LRLALGQSATLSGGLTDSLNNAVTAIAPFTYKSRNRLVASIDASTGVITTNSIGGVGLLVSYPKGAVNASFNGAPYSTGTIDATVQLTVVSA
jgi:hypothetical protein